MTRPLRSARITGPQRYYETVRPRAPRRYSAPCGGGRLKISLSPPAPAGDSIGATGSHVPCKSPGQARAAYMPDAIWAVSRLPPDLSRSPGHAPVSTPLRFITTRQQRFAFARLPDPHLTRSPPRLFPQRSPRTALNRRSLRWFEASPCRATPEDLPPSLAQHRIQWLLHQALLQRSWHTEGFKLRPIRQLGDRLAHSWCRLIGEAEYHNPRVTARRVAADVTHATVQGDKHPCFCGSGGNHVRVASSGKAFRGNGVHIVTAPSQGTRGRNWQVLVEFELHRECGSGSSSSRANAAP